MTSRIAVARAHANIALIKYWGKRDALLNLPAAGSLSLTLSELYTDTRVEFSDQHDADRLTLDDRPVTGSGLKRLTAWLDIVRMRAGTSAHAHVESRNNFPTSAGLASSASAYAALAMATSAAIGLPRQPSAVSELARLGSGSAARSLFGGLVRMHAGTRADGTDCFAEPIPATWELRMVIAIVGDGSPKAHSSRDAMEHCAATSPLYSGWLACVPNDLLSAQRAIERQDFTALGRVVEANALAMHATAMASRPAIHYWQPGTIACLATVRTLRGQGVEAYATMDAGPHVKVLTRPADTTRVAAALTSVPYVSDVRTCTPGAGARVIPALGAP